MGISLFCIKEAIRISLLVTRSIPLSNVLCSDAKVARQAANTTLRAVNELVLVMSEEPHVSAHNPLPDM